MKQTKGKDWREELIKVLNTEVSYTWTKLTLAKAFNEATEKAVKEAVEAERARIESLIPKNKEFKDGYGYSEDRMNHGFMGDGWNEAISIMQEAITKDKK